MLFAIFIEEISINFRKETVHYGKKHSETSPSEVSWNGFPWRTPANVFIKQLVVDVVV